LFVLAATGGILLLADNPHGGEHLKDLLVGQILWVSFAQLIPVAVLTAIICILWFRFEQKLGHTGFYLLFAVSVTASVQLVGIYLVFASLIVPALASRHYTRGRLAAGYGLGAAGYAIGLVFSALLDLPSGAVLVWALAALGILFYAFQGKASAKH
jgi:zinc/manganese transport system permease protein